MQSNPHFAELLTSVTADESKASVDVSTFDRIVLYFQGSGTINSGQFTIGEAASVGYTGTWSTITTVTAADVTGGVTKALHLPDAAYKCLQVRVDTAIGGGGDITVFLEAH